MMTSLGLKARGLAVAYGPIAALRDVDLDLRPGEVVALIGANGAGKSSLLRALSGLVPAQGSARLFQGEAESEARELIGANPSQIPRLGVAHVPEGRGIFLGLSVRDNLRAGAILRGDRGAVRDDLERQLTRFPRLRERLDRPALTLSGGEQQMLAIGRALMARPRMLWLDEPSLGLAPKLVAEVFRTIQALSDQGMTILLVEQNARMALRAAGRAYVLEAGKIALSGPAAELARDDQVRAAYLGGAASTTSVAVPPSTRI